MSELKDREDRFVEDRERITALMTSDLEAVEILRGFVKDEPIHQAGTFTGLCVYCEMLDIHDETCPWIKAKALLQRLKKDFEACLDCGQPLLERMRRQAELLAEAAEVLRDFAGESSTYHSVSIPDWWANRAKPLLDKLGERE